MKKLATIIAVVIMLSLTAYNSNNTIENDPAYSSDTETVSQTASVLTYDEPEKSANNEVAEPEEVQPDRTINKPDTKLINSNTILISSSLENVDSIRLYSYEVSSESGGVVTQDLIFEGIPEDITTGEISFDTQNVIKTETYEKDNSAIKTDYYAKGVKLCLSNEENEEWSDFMGLEVSFDTGVCNQYNCAFHGSTACGAANGTLLLQTVVPVWGSELTARMSAIRDYSALGYEYSAMADIDYCMTGIMVYNSVNKYMEDNGIEGYRITDLGTEDKPTEEIIIEAINTGRPAAIMVSYRFEVIYTDYQGYGHWITINAYRIDENGEVWLRWENTLTNKQYWVDSVTADKAIRVFTEGEGAQQSNNRPPLYMPDGTEVKLTRHVDALSEPVVDSFV